MIVFFVLSGYVIAYVADQKERCFGDFLASRIARIYSVLLPALLLTLVLDGIGKSWSPQLYQSYDRPWLHFLANLGCLQQIFNQSIRCFSNGPMWSIGYEFWYYIVYGLCLFFGKKTWTKVLVLVWVILFYKVAVLFPIWLLGVLAYKINQKSLLSTKPALIAYPLSFLMIALLELSGELLHFAPFPSLGYSRYFVGDYLIGALVFVNILSVKQFPDYFVHLTRPIRFLQSFSFSIYLYHFPILLFLLAVFRYNAADKVQSVLIALFVLVLCYALSLFTEQKKGLIKSACLIGFNRLLPGRTRRILLSKSIG